MKPGRRRLTVASLAAVCFIVLTAATLWTVNAYARRSPTVACRLGAGVTLYSSLDRLPEPFTAYLSSKLAEPAGLPAELGGLAPRDGYFNATDIVIPALPIRRFIGGGRAGNRWFLWYEHGGFAIHAHLVVVDLPPGAIAPLPRANMTAWPPPRLCALTAGVLFDRAAATLGEEW
jgi:hypothetical protein